MTIQTHHPTPSSRSLPSLCARPLTNKTIVISLTPHEHINTAGMQYYFKTFAWKNTSIKDFMNAIEIGSKTDLSEVCMYVCCRSHFVYFFVITLLLCCCIYVCVCAFDVVTIDRCHFVDMFSLMLIKTHKHIRKHLSHTLQWAAVWLETSGLNTIVPIWSVDEVCVYIFICLE